METLLSPQKRLKTQQRNRFELLPTKTIDFACSKKMQHQRLLLHPPKVRFSLVQRAVVALLHHFWQPGRIRPGKDKRGVDLISDVLPFGRL
jgi:hypothetical protein